MRMKLQAKDNITVSDFKIKGLVKIYSNGEKILEKENMIVKGGRDYIMQRVLKKFINWSAEGDKPDISDYEFTSIKLGYGTGATTLDSKMLVLNDYIKNKNDMDGSDISYDLDTRSVTFKCDFAFVPKDGDNNITAHELGLYIGKEGADEILFSRLAFDPIVLTPSDSFSLEYTFYF